MSAKTDYIAQQQDTCRKEWFKDHTASIIAGSLTFETPVLIIGWQKPDTWNYGCRFIIYRRWLCVVGDIGEATFEWNQDITPEFLGSLDFGYFMSKCEASPSGKDFEDWDNNVASRNVQERIAELRQSTDLADEDQRELEVLTEELLWDMTDKDGARLGATDYFENTGDAEGASSLSTMGKVPSVHAIGMFVGLQMAIAQLTKKS